MEFKNPIIYSTFYDECLRYYIGIYDSHVVTKNWQFKYEQFIDMLDFKYEQFIDMLDLGIKVKRVLDNGEDVYEVIDEKKWLLNKIKYGI